MPRTVNSAGTLVYDWRDTISAATWGGKDLLPFKPIEILVDADGWGRVSVLVPMDTASVGTIPPRVQGQQKPLQYGTAEHPGNLLDGTTRVYEYWGNVTVTP